MTILDDIWDFLEELCRDDEVRANLKGAGGMAGAAAGGAGAGALIGGPIGGLGGAIIGGIVGFATCNDFKPLPQILRRMDNEKKQRLTQKVQQIMSQRNITDVATLAVAATHGTALRNILIEQIRNH